MASNKKIRKTYDDTFRINVVKAWRASGQSAKSNASNYGILEQYL